MIQTTLFQLDNYGPWTTTPTLRREMDLQTLQSRLYTEIAGFVSFHGGYAFYTRADNMIAVTNGIDRAAHESFQRVVRNQYPVTLSAGIGVGATPRAAVTDASEKLQSAGSAQDETRRQVCRGSILANPNPVQIAHFDIIDATSKYTDQHDAFGAYLTISSAYGLLAERLYHEYDGLAFFVGGDNIVAICPQLSEQRYEQEIDHIRQTAGIDLRVGIGQGVTAEIAGMAAKHGLEAAREHGQTVGQSNANTTAEVDTTT